MMTFKTTLKTSAVIVSVALMGAMTATTASAAGKGFCKNYAKIAVKQNKRNFINGCGFTGWRWHSWKKGHYKWCRDASMSKAISERWKREALLGQC